MALRAPGAASVARNTLISGWAGSLPATRPKLSSPRYSPAGRLIATPIASAVSSAESGWANRRTSALRNAAD